ncbi:hypothetical protein ACIBG4_14905 [Nonomuraea sp. NPDC050383]|uniref:hypothetical protein n=1 Tax=Nonomuraea sp. NPDC050383 TaxID=3364362 RepID=UPI003796035A
MSERNPLQIPECDVETDADGIHHLKHRSSQETATASTPEQAHVQGAILRSHAALTRELQIWTGDLP